MNNLVFRGRVEKGEGIARQLGCPTANIEVHEGGIIPGLGVYVGDTEIEGRHYPSVICVNDGRKGLVLKMEVHLLGIEQNLIGEYLVVSLFEKLRDLVTWENDTQMRMLISGDLAQARKWFAEHPLAHAY